MLICIQSTILIMIIRLFLAEGRCKPGVSAFCSASNYKCI